MWVMNFKGKKENLQSAAGAATNTFFCMFSRCSAELGKPRSCHTHTHVRGRGPPTVIDLVRNHRPACRGATDILAKRRRHPGQGPPKLSSGSTESIVKGHGNPGQGPPKSWS